LIVLKQALDKFPGNPQPQDLALVVEIADSTLALDLTTKAALYARAGIVEYWVIDVTGRRLYCHREPMAGKYSQIAVYEEHEAISPLAAPDAPFQPAIAFRKSTT
jgi:Uma2 family endonuclease